jgi:hypothetical protein
MIGDEPINSCRYELVFTGEEERTSERRTHIVISLTSAMMVLEIITGVLLGSMALLADGWHMASHAAALGITALGYAIARRHALNPIFLIGSPISMCGGSAPVITPPSFPWTRARKPPRPNTRRSWNISASSVTSLSR